MKRKMYKVIALLMTLAMPVGLALSEETLEMPDGALLDLGMQQDETELEIGGEAAPVGESTAALPEELDSVDLDLGSLDPVSEATYRFVVGDVEYTSQKAQAGETILRPADPEAPGGKAFAGWMRADGTSLFADANADGEIDPVIVQDYELGTEVYVWAQFIDPEKAGQPAEAQPQEQPAEEAPVEETPSEEEPSEVAPAEETPAEEAPVTEEPIAEETTEQDPAEKTPLSEEPVAEEPSEQESTQEEPAEEAPAEQEPTQEEPEVDAPAEEAPVTEEPVEEEPEEEAPAEQEPTQEEPEVESPAEEAPVTEEPAEQAPTQKDQPTGEAQPVANALTYTGEAQPLVSVEGAWLYSLDGETYSKTVPTAINAGEYTVFFKAAEADEPQAITVTVAKADAVFTPPVPAVSE